MKEWWIASGGPLAVLLAVILGAGTAAAAPAPLCGEFVPGNQCGDSIGDAACGDPGLDCVPNAANDGCECKPRVCCRCETVGTGTDCDLPVPCTDTVLPDLALCVLPCFIIDATSAATCNLKVVNNARCSGDDCPTTGCCAFEFCQNPDPMDGDVCLDDGGFSNLCAETNQATCDLTRFGQFVAGGSCESLFGACVSPTPTSTPTGTATDTATATATSTATSTDTPTHTASATDTPTVTPTVTATATSTATASHTLTQTLTPTLTPTITATPTRTPPISPTTTGTATATATITRLPDGADCTTPSQCQSSFCVDGVCCNTACDQPMQTCDALGQRGTCTGSAPAPAPLLSATGLAIGLAFLALVGAVSLLWRARPR